MSDSFSRMIAPTKEMGFHSHHPLKNSSPRDREVSGRTLILLSFWAFRPETDFS